MSIAPPSDIVLDVAQAADPLRLRGATARLDALAAGNAAAPGKAAEFGAVLAAAAPPGPVRAAPSSSLPTPLQAGAPHPGLSPYQKFEAVLLQTFVQEMLPKNDDLYGDAASADAYRGLMAEQLSEQLARTGGIGIARIIEKAEAARHAPTTASGVPGGPAPDKTVRAG